MASASLQQRTPAWHAARKGKLTASNLGAALGLCPWTTRQQAFDRAMGLEKFTGDVFNAILGAHFAGACVRVSEWCECDGICNGACHRCIEKARALRKWRARVAGAGNDATRWGTQNEANGILAYTAHTGNLVQNTGLHVHPYTSWLAGSPDGLIGTEGMLEVKCPFWRRKGGSRVHTDVPPHYYMQVNLCMECSGRDWCDFISWAPEGYRIFRITRDKDLHEKLTPYYLNFFAAMQRMAKTPPVLSEGDKEFIQTEVDASMKAHIMYDFWAKADLQQSPPETEESDDDLPPAKRTKSSPVD